MFTQKLMTTHMWKVVSKNSNKVADLLLSSDQDASVDVFNVMNRFTLDLGFGKSIGALDNADSPFLNSFDKGQQILFMRLVSLGWIVQRKLRLFHERSSAHHFRLLKQYSLEKIQGLKQKIDSAAGDSFVSKFMKEQARTGKPYDDQFLQDLVLNFLIAGRDATVRSLSWTFFLLRTHPHVEKRVLEESGDLIGDRGSHTQISTSSRSYKLW